MKYSVLVSGGRSAGMAERMRMHHHFRTFSCSDGRQLRRVVPMVPIALLIVCFFFAAKWMVSPEGMIDGGEKEEEETERDFERLLYYVQHPRTVCHTALFLGGRREGGEGVDGDKVVCQDQGVPLRQPCLVYSFGGNDEWSFEEEIENFGCEVYTFDPSLKKGAHKHSNNIWFYPLGISDFDENRFIQKEMTTWRMRTLDSILEFLGHRNRSIDVLKLDIEGDEWKVLDDLSTKGLLKKVNHLCVEVHLHSGQWSRKLRTLRRLEEDNMRFFSSRKNLVTKPREVPGVRGGRREQLFYELAWFRDRDFMHS